MHKVLQYQAVMYPRKGK